MYKIIFLSVIFIASSVLQLNAQLEIEMNHDGLFFPRMNTTDRNLLTPASGQCIFNIDAACIECFDFGGNWRSYDFRRINDSDNNTYVTAEKTSNSDMINMAIGGTEVLTLRNNSQGKFYYDNLYDQGNIIFGGGGTGLSFDGGAFRNTSFGHVSFFALTTGDDNTGFGTQNLTLNETGSNNVAIGSQVLEMGTAIERNIGVGVRTLNLSDGPDNLALGYEALKSVTTGSNNTAIGNFAMLNLTSSSSDNLAIGKNALLSIAVSNSNFAIGNNAGENLQSSSNNNVLLGHNALKSCTTGGSDNIVIGSAMTNADVSPTTFISPLSNVAIGTVALNNTSGRYNIGIGWQALTFHENGTGNVALGVEALSGLQNGNRNTAVGFGAMMSAQGTNSTGIGHGAGQFAIGSNNVFLGNEAGAGETGDGKLHIANTSTKTLIEGDFTNDEVTINNVMNLTPRSSIPSTPSTGSIYMDDGTNTGGTPTLRVYIDASTGWKDL